MPSTSVSAKVDKQQSSTVVAPAQNAAAPTAEAAAVAAAAAAAAAAANAVDNSTPIRQVLVIIEHKIRNLEKRKVCLVRLQVSAHMRDVEAAPIVGCPPCWSYTIHMRHRRIHAHTCTHTEEHRLCMRACVCVYACEFTRLDKEGRHVLSHPKCRCACVCVGL